MEHVPLKDETGRQIGHVLVDPDTGFMTGVVTDEALRSRIFASVAEGISLGPYRAKPEPTIRPSRLAGHRPDRVIIDEITTLPEGFQPAARLLDTPGVHRVKAYLDGKLAQGGIVTGGPLVGGKEGSPERIVPLPTSRDQRATLGQHIAWHSPDVAVDGCLYCERAHSEIPRCVERLRFSGTNWRCSLAAGHGHTLEGDGHDYTTPEPTA